MPKLILLRNQDFLGSVNIYDNASAKILNVYNVSLSKIADNNEIQNLIHALGCGLGKNFNMSNLRYEKIILMTDADVDGSHIATLLITFFFKYMRKIIESGRLYLAMPPLYKITYKNDNYFAFDEKEKDKILKSNHKNIKPQITRFKGLGEMPADQLKQTTMDDKKRLLIQIKLQDGEKENVKTEKLFNSLMGKKAENRFNFIQENANFLREEIDKIITTHSPKASEIYYSVENNYFVPDCNSQCDENELEVEGNPDCNGSCGSNDHENSADCNELCEYGESSSGVDCDGICDVGEDSDSYDCNGICDNIKLNSLL